MSDYDLRPGGSLKLKAVADGGIVKKSFIYRTMDILCSSLQQKKEVKVQDKT
jgi:hypothetical protein